jgi:hypothetical protein
LTKKQINASGWPATLPFKYRLQRAPHWLHRFKTQEHTLCFACACKHGKARQHTGGSSVAKVRQVLREVLY